MKLAALTALFTLSGAAIFYTVVLLGVAALGYGLSKI